MMNNGKPEGNCILRTARFILKLIRNALLFFLGLSVLLTITTIILVTAYPDEWDKVDPNRGLKEAEKICGPPVNYGAWPEKCVVWEWGTEWIYWEFILYSGNGSRTQVCFCKNAQFCKGCVDFKIDQSYEDGLIRGLKKIPHDVVKFLWH